MTLVREWDLGGSASRYYISYYISIYIKRNMIYYHIISHIILYIIIGFSDHEPPHCERGVVLICKARSGFVRNCKEFWGFARIVRAFAQVVWCWAVTLRLTLSGLLVRSSLRLRQTEPQKGRLSGDDGLRKALRDLPWLWSVPTISTQAKWAPKRPPEWRWWVDISVVSHKVKICMDGLSEYDGWGFRGQSLCEKSHLYDLWLLMGP